VEVKEGGECECFRENCKRLSLWCERTRSGKYQVFCVDGSGSYCLLLIGGYIW